MQRFFRQLLPFIFMGVAIVILIYGLMLLAYLFLFGVIIGLVLFAINWVRDQLFGPKKQPPSVRRPGRTFDSDDWNKM